MKLDGLISLYKSMRDQDINRYRFNYKHAKASFDVFFFVDSDPFILLFGAQGDNFGFKLEVLPGFLIKLPLDKDIYSGLCKVLGIQYNPTNHFSPKDFFAKFNRELPNRADKSSTAQPHEIAKYHSNLEESEKVYFLGWRDNTIRGENVSSANLRKTIELLGVAAHEVSLSKNVSSCWTADLNNAKVFFLPS